MASAGVQPERSVTSPLRAFGVLVAHSFQRHWRVRQMGWVAVGLLSVCVLAVAGTTSERAGKRRTSSKVRASGTGK